MTKRSLPIAVLVLSAAIIAGLPCRLYAARSVSIPIRVSIRKDAGRIDLVVRGRYAIFDLGSGKLLMKGKRLRSEVYVFDGRILIAGREIGSLGISIVPKRDSSIYVDKRRYRGILDIIRTGGLKLLVINRLDLEDYLCGVLPHEVSHRWPMEALKAQAVVARTFAMYQKMMNKNRDYDVDGGTSSQMYGGRTCERWRTTRAVKSTRHQVLIFNGEIFPTYYHATCAGHTERASNLWNIDIEPLKGVECNFCRNSPHYRWSKEIALKSLKSRLEDAGYKMGKIVSLEIASRNESGRVGKLKLTDSAGITILITAKDLRSIIGPNRIKSTKFDLMVDGGYVTFRGFGWGHGVGMCQWGAYGMARRGYKAGDILKYYYPGAEVADVYKVMDEL